MKNTTGSDNTATGNLALGSNQTGNANVADGVLELHAAIQRQLELE